MDLQPIPGPTPLPFLGNMLNLRDEEAPLRALERLADIYGPIYQLTLAGEKTYVVSNAEMMKEVMDEKRFLKTKIFPLSSPAGKPNGVIVAGTLDEEWGVGHRILRPAFGPLRVEGMFEDMKDIAHQLVLKWARFGPDEEIAITEDFSNLTLDTIALCTMDFRFNSFYRNGAHPYVQAMNVSLGAAGQRQANIPIISTALSYINGGAGTITKERVQDAQAFMKKTAQEIIDNRRARSERKNDFLDMLLFGKDPKTGVSMSDELIQAQMQSFLIAGHETTSGMLSFAVIKLLQNPETYQKAQEEVDRVVGDGQITLEHVRNLKYIYAVLQETLRLIPTAPMISKIPHPDRKNEPTIIGGKYKIEQGQRVRLLLGKCMEDPKVFGEDAREFRPDRMMESNPDYPGLEPYWRPFSEGQRACLGRPFSMQEAVLALALVLQNFDLRMADPMYKMRIKHAVTIKPLDLHVYAKLRHGITPADVEQRLHSGKTVPRRPQKSEQQGSTTNSTDGTPLMVLYGTNTGTCLALAQRLASETSSHGFRPEVLEMDGAADRLSASTPVIILTPSYEGQPPDNALQFVQSLESRQCGNLKGVKFAIFGCGHRDWRATHHRIPKLVDGLMEEQGGERIAAIGLSDVSQGNPMADFEAWMGKTLFPQLRKLSSMAQDDMSSTSLDVEAEISTGGRVALLHQDLHVGTVKDVQVLTASGEQPEKRHIGIELPEGSTYECGDYLAVLPQSPEQSVRAVMAHFKLPSDATIVLQSQTFAPLPLHTTLSVHDILRNYYELSKPATRRGVSLALKHTSDQRLRSLLSAYLDDDQKFQKGITEQQVSLLSLLKTHKEIDMPFPSFLACLPPLAIRQYSISSSPLRDPTTCTLTYSVITDEKDPQKPFYGVASTYLASLKAGDRLQVATRRTAKQAFRLPHDAEKTPLLMVAAGTGLAPFRGFIEQRAIQLQANADTKLAPAYLFFGCRHSQRDRLYAAQMDEWEKLGAVKIFYSYSQEPEMSEGCRHVNDRMTKEEELIARAWLDGARAYVCGNRGLADSVHEAAKAIVEKRLAERQAEGWTEQRIEARRHEIFASFNERAADDVFD